MFTVGIGEYIVSDDKDEKVITYALGSCVAFIVHCPISKKTAMAHIVLPEAERVEQYDFMHEKPGYFAEAIVPMLIEFFKRESHCTLRQLEISIVGGADAKDPNDVFKVGRRNVEKVREYLNKYNVYPVKMDVGGTVSRTVEINIRDGCVKIRSHNMNF